jgi:Lar family restriction alleviation protein
MTQPSKSESLDELKPCPFCGGDAGLGSDDAFDDVTWQAFCKRCHATIERDLADHAVELWNTRALTANQERVTQLEAALRKCRDRFTEYAHEHQVKYEAAFYPPEKDEHMAKADRNLDMAMLCDAALKGDA